jgi:hypothetical protein
MTRASTKSGPLPNAWNVRDKIIGTAIIVAPIITTAYLAYRLLRRPGAATA